MPSTYWLSYGGGVNSTALAILLAQGEFQRFQPWRIVMADTGDEKKSTYEYVETVFRPWLTTRGKHLEIARPKETVLDRWKRLRVTGSRIIRACSVEGKINPIGKYVKANGGSLGQLIGIDAGESHRARQREAVFYPLVEAGIDRDACVGIIEKAGLPVPVKSGCWHCPFMRVGEVIELAKTNPCALAQIEQLETIATATHGVNPVDGGPRTHWGDRPVSYWRDRAAQGNFFIPERDQESPCDCYDG